MRSSLWMLVVLGACSPGFEPVDDTGDTTDDTSDSLVDSESDSEVVEETDTPDDTSPPEQEVYPTCADAMGKPPRPAGTYSGTVAAWGAELAPTCAGSPEGPDGVIPVRVPAGDALIVEYTLDENAGVTWLSGECGVDNCAQVGRVYDVGGTPTLLWKNDGGTPRDWSIILDAEEGNVPGNTPFSVSFRTATPTATTAVDTCGAAGAIAPTPPGLHVIDLSGMTNKVTLDLGTCGFPWDMPAREGILRITLEAGKTLTAILESGEVDAAMYLMRNCATQNTCVATADDHIGGRTERLTYTNSTASTAAFYLVVDGWEEDDQPGRVHVWLDID